jgi:hypothetical protein
MEHLNSYQKLDWISFAIQEALNGNHGELMQALKLVEALREIDNGAPWNFKHVYDEHDPDPCERKAS